MEVKAVEAAQTHRLTIDLSNNYLTNLPTSLMNFIVRSLVHLNIEGNFVVFIRALHLLKYLFMKEYKKKLLIIH